MIKGSCLCEKVQYECEGEITASRLCHCNLCKRANGSVFATNGSVEFAKLKFSCGEELLKSYESTKGKLRFFCSNCGSHIYGRRGEDEPEISLRLGTVTEGFIPSTEYQIFGDSKSKWFKGTDNIPCYSEAKGSKILDN